MPKIWASRILHGDQHFSSCPEKFRDEVLSILRGMVDDMSFSEDDFELLTGIKFDEQ